MFTVYYEDDNGPGYAEFETCKEAASFERDVRLGGDVILTKEQYDAITI